MHINVLGQQYEVLSVAEAGIGPGLLRFAGNADYDGAA